MNVRLNLIFLFLAIVCFLIATFIAIGDASFKYGPALIPAGLLFLAASFWPVHHAA